MAVDVRCVCPCHTHSGTYPPPCNVCGHDTREGRWVGGYRGWWEPNGDPRDEQIARLTARLAERDDLAERLAAAEAAIREALYDYDHGDEISAVDRLRAALAASEGASPVTRRTITMRCHCGRGVTIGPDPWCEGCVQSAATCDCVPATQGMSDA